MSSTILSSLAASRQLVLDLESDAGLQARLEQAVDLCVAALSNGKKILFAGNGGSAAESQHFAAELVGRFLKERSPLAAVALNTDTSALTAIGNDYGYEHVFARQVQAIGQAGDVLVGLSTSGRSRNLVVAFQAAQHKGLQTISLTGRDPRDLGPLSSVILNMPSDHTPQIQEGHLIIGHLLCGLIEERLLGR
jgi:D-sedoheptulose 7-phosphate isomerase